MKKRFEKKYNLLKKDAYQWVILEIRAYCKKYGWEFNSGWRLSVKNKHGKELSNNNYLKKLIYWYEDNFDLFPQIVVDRTGKLIK